MTRLPSPPTEPENAFPEEPDKIKQIPCKYCHKLFTPSRPWQLFCVSKHRTAYHTIQRILDREEK